MTRLIRSSIICACLGISTFAFASESTLSIANHVEYLDVSVTVDLLCGKFVNTITPKSPRYTSPLDENPIKTSQTPVDITWKNCAITKTAFTASDMMDDHGKIQLALQDLSTGEHTDITFQVAPFEQTKEVSLAGRTITVKLDHSGDYDNFVLNTIVIPTVTQTKTVITVD